MSAVMFLLAVIAVILSWNHVIPGGWFLRGIMAEPGVWRAREAAAHRGDRLAVFDSEGISTTAGTVVFLGSSTIEKFPLEASFKGHSCLNRGIGMESTSSLVDRLERSMPPAMRPHVGGVVLYGGGVDLRREGRSVSESVQHVREALAGIRRLVPDVDILLMGVLPGRSGESRESGALLDELNGSLKKMADELGVSFLETCRKPLRDDGGRLSESHSADPWHLNAAGYEVLADWIRSGGGPVGRQLR